MADLVGEESGLPLIICPKCKRGRLIELIERRSKKENVNLGRVYIKCPRDKSWMPDRCDYYKWQRNYFEELVDKKVIDLVTQRETYEVDDQVEEEREVRSVTRGKEGSSMQSKKIEENMEKLMKAMQLVIIMLFSFTALLVVLFLFK
ncbi:unnamed protein product [Urochloa humidicola]